MPLALSLRAVDWPIINRVQIRCAVVRYFALVSDFDSVIAEDGHQSQVALTAIARRRASGRRVILLTGRGSAIWPNRFHAGNKLTSWSSRMVR